MSSSEEFQRYKELYYEDGLAVVSVTIQGSTGTVLFKKREETIEVSGSSNDFVDQLSKLVPTKREGLEQFIELSETTSDTVVEYYEKMEYFSSDSENPVDDAARRLKLNETSIPDDLQWRKGLIASVHGELTNSDLTKIIQNYFKAIAVVRSDKYKIESVLNRIRTDTSYDKQRFEKYQEQARTILQKHFHTESPFKDYKRFIEICDTDAYYLSERMADSKRKRHADWEGLFNRELDEDDPKNVLSFEKMGQSNPREGQIEADIGTEKILDHYSDVFELVREPLRDIAIILDHKGRDLSNTGNILKFLESNQAQTFSNAIEPYMRHGSAHNQISLRTDKPIIEFYNNRGRGRELVKKMSYQEVLERYYCLTDMALGLLLSFNHFDYNISYRYLGSKEFQFRVVERM